MNSAHLNEHDANQGAQSSGEFLGMTGNSGWWLFGSAGTTILMVVFLWGILGMSLLLCLLIGAVLCALSLLYVFTLKNSRPEHYDMDFFESVFAEAGITDFRFGPRARRLRNPFTETDDAKHETEPRRERKAGTPAMTRSRQRIAAPVGAAANEALQPGEKVSKKKPAAKPPVVITEAAYELVREELEQTKELLDEALAGHPEDSP